jgi:hypothetical protein
MAPMMTRESLLSSNVRLFRPIDVRTYLNVLFGIEQIFKKGVFSPGHTGLFVGGTVRVIFGLTTLPAKEAVEIRSLLVSATGFHRMALRTFCFENLGSLRFTHIGSLNPVYSFVCVQYRMIVAIGTGFVFMTAPSPTTNISINNRRMAWAKFRQMLPHV